ncbi:MAG: peptidoglycan DD-metalloendopeptidase family protein [Anaerolineales bacterium]
MQDNPFFGRESRRYIGQRRNRWRLVTSVGCGVVIVAAMVSAFFFVTANAADPVLPATPPPQASPTSAAVAAFQTPDVYSGATPVPTRSLFGPGEKLPYTTQSGDYVVVLAKRFNTTIEEILAANPGLPVTTTLPSGMPLQIPSYYLPLGGTPFKIIPDSELVYGPAQKAFSIAAYLELQPGPVKRYSAFVNRQQRDAAATIGYVARQYSINPKLLLALMEWRSGALTNPQAAGQPFGALPREARSDWYLQMIWVAEQLTEGYYGYRTGSATEISLPDTYRVRIDSYQNAGTVAVQHLISKIVPREEFDAAVGPDGFAATYRTLWGDVWQNPPDVLTGELTQPALTLPFEPNRIWTFTGGPHPAWGRLVPWAAVDFAPAGISGCGSSAEYTRAVADGVIVRAGDSTVVLDLDGDGYEGTGWEIFYFHMAEANLVRAGTRVKQGDPIGHPSCEGGSATGTHVHIARRYNGEWMAADGIVPLNFGGWVAVRGPAAYLGRMERLGQWVEASVVSTDLNRLYWVP